MAGQCLLVRIRRPHLIVLVRCCRRDTDTCASIGRFPCWVLSISSRLLRRRALASCLRWSAGSAVICRRAVYVGLKLSSCKRLHWRSPSYHTFSQRCPLFHTRRPSKLVLSTCLITFAPRLWVSSGPSSPGHWSQARLYYHRKSSCRPWTDRLLGSQREHRSCSNWTTARMNSTAASLTIVRLPASLLECPFSLRI